MGTKRSQVMYIHIFVTEECKKDGVEKKTSVFHDVKNVHNIPADKIVNALSEVVKELTK
jgi:hypothetical protein